MDEMRDKAPREVNTAAQLLEYVDPIPQDRLARKYLENELVKN